MSSTPMKDFTGLGLWMTLLIVTTILHKSGWLDVAP
jgi:hypothetical protein